MTPDVEVYLEKKIEVIEKFVAGDPSSSLRIEMGRNTVHHQSGDVYRAEFNLHIAGKDFRAVSEQSDLLSAIDKAKDELVESVRSHKDRQVSYVRRRGREFKNFIRGFF